MRRSIFLSFAYIDLKLLTQLPFCYTISQAWVCSFHTKIYGNCTSTLCIYVYTCAYIKYWKFSQKVVQRCSAFLSSPQKLREMLDKVCSWDAPAKQVVHVLSPCKSPVYCQSQILGAFFSEETLTLFFVHFSNSLIEISVSLIERVLFLPNVKFIKV